MENSLKNFKDASISPCLTCSSAPCCSHLPLKELRANTFLQIDEIRFYLNFQNIRISLDNNGIWKIYYHQTCRFFDPETNYCTIHNQETQPNVCVHYNPYKCYYKKVNEAKNTFSKEIIWMNPERLNCLQSYLLFDNHRNICAWPETGHLFQELSKIPYKETYHRITDTDDKIEAWKKSVSNPANFKVSEDSSPRDFYQSKNPCSNCQAYCCTALVFPMNAPTNFSKLDFYKYSLGFEGVQIGISNGNWALIVKTKCRHLTKDHQCALYGKNERPLVCQYYDAGNCNYKKDFGLLRPAGYLRVRYEEFKWILQMYEFDDQGNIIHQKDVESMRQQIEEQWKQLVTTPHL